MRCLYTLFALLLTLNSWLHIAHAQDESTWMPDANLRTAVRNALGLANDDTLTQEVMTNLTELIAGKSDIANITGLEHATNLTDLQLTFNSITDISPLRNLTNLTRLLLSNNQIGDITDLGNLTNLEILSLKNCGITDVSPLQTLVNLTTLRIAGNNLTNAHLLSTLTNLQDIDITIPDPPLVVNDIDISIPVPPPPDVDPPGVSLTIPSGVQNGAFSVKITFTESVFGFTESDLSLSGTATALITAWHTTENTTYTADTIIYIANTTTYTATITPTTSGTVTLNVAANVATDVANNPNTAATPQTVNVDVDRPTVTISVPSDTQTGAFDATITFSETVSGFDQSDVSLTGSAASITAWNVNTDNTVYTATITPTASGTVTVGVAANVATDAANNPNTAATAQTATVSLDTDAPSVSISVPSGVQNSAFDATITFSETVSGFEQNDLVIAGTADATITAWEKKETGKTVYTAEITPKSNGIVKLSIPAGVAIDAARNPNTPSAAQQVEIDMTRPDVSFSFDLEEEFVTPVGYITNGPFVMTIIFTEPVSGFEQSDLEVDDDWTYTDFKAIDPETIDAVVYADTYTVKVIPNPNDDSLYIGIHIEAGVATDAAGNPNTSANSPRIRVEKFRPNVVISVPDSDVTTTTFTIEIKFDGGDARDDRPLGFEQADVSLTNNTAGATITTWTEKQRSFRSSTHGTFQGGYGAFEAEITATQSGTVTFGVPENVATDLAGNGNTAAVQKTVTITLADNQGEAPLAGLSKAHLVLDPAVLKTLDRDALEAQLDLLYAKSDGSPKYRRTIKLIESILATMRPDETRLLTNYPNPFNPETWIPYHLANRSNVSIIIYNMRGNVIRRLELGHQQAGYYTSRSRAAHWDGTNDFGERVATGTYFYQLQADNASLLRKMVILK